MLKQFCPIYHKVAAIKRNFPIGGVKISDSIRELGELQLSIHAAFQTYHSQSQAGSGFPSDSDTESRSTQND